MTGKTVEDARRIVGDFMIEQGWAPPMAGEPVGDASLRLLAAIVEHYQDTTDDQPTIDLDGCGLENEGTSWDPFDPFDNLPTTPAP